MITPGLAFISTSDASRTSTAASRPSTRRAPAPVGSLLPESVDGGTYVPGALTVVVAGEKPSAVALTWIFSPFVDEAAVGHREGAAELIVDRVVDVRQGRGVGGDVERAAGVLGDLLERGRGRRIGGDADRVHVDARLLGGRDGLVERCRVVIRRAVREQHDHALLGRGRRQGLAMPARRRRTGPCPTRSPATSWSSAVSTWVRSWPIGAAGVDLVAEAVQADRRRRLLRLDERLGRVDRVRQLAAGHALRLVDQERDRGRSAGIRHHRVVRRHPVLEELELGCLAHRVGAHGDVHHREVGGVHLGDLQRAARRGGRSRHDERHQRCDDCEEPPAHWPTARPNTPPPPAAAARSGLSGRKKFGGRLTPFDDILSRKCGLMPVQVSGPSSR